MRSIFLLLRDIFFSGTLLCKEIINELCWLWLLSRVEHQTFHTESKARIVHMVAHALYNKTLHDRYTGTLLFWTETY